MRGRKIKSASASSHEAGRAGASASSMRCQTFCSKRGGSGGDGRCARSNVCNWLSSAFMFLATTDSPVIGSLIFPPRLANTSFAAPVIKAYPVQWEIPQKKNPGREVDPPTGTGRMKPRVVGWQTTFDSDPLNERMQLTCQTGFPRVARVWGVFQSKGGLYVVFIALRGQMHSWKFLRSACISGSD